MDEITHVPPLIAQMIRKDLGKYGGNSGTNKLYHLMSVIDHLVPIIGEDKVAEAVDKDLERLKKYEKESGNLTISQDVKNWNHIWQKLKELRPVLQKIQSKHEEMTSKINKKINYTSEIDYKRLNSGAILYQAEIYYIHHIVLSSQVCVTEIGILTS